MGQIFRIFEIKQGFFVMNSIAGNVAENNSLTEM